MAIIQWNYKLSNWRRLVHNKSKMLHANWHSQLILKSNRKQQGIKSHTHDQFKLTEIKVTYFKQKWLFCTKPFINLLQIMVKIILWDEFRLISAILCSVYKHLIPYSYDGSPPPRPFSISSPQGWGRVKKLIAKAKSLKFYFTNDKNLLESIN